jgi:hypothetical protein
MAISRRPPQERFLDFHVPSLVDFVSRVMLYPWPIACYPMLDEALQIAMNYLELTGQAGEYTKVQSQAAREIIARWRAGERRKLRLANYAIVAIENKVTHIPLRENPFYPRAS